LRDPEKALKAAGLRPGQRVLEAGCGPGFFTVPAAKLVGGHGSLVSLDINPLAVEKVRQRIDDAQVDNAEIMFANACDTKLPDGSFDLAFLFGFPWRKGGKRDILKEMHRVLKPEGTLAYEGRPFSDDEFFELVTCESRISKYRKKYH